MCAGRVPERGEWSMLSREQLVELEGHLAQKGMPAACDGTLKAVRSWLRKSQMDIDACVMWLEGRGCFCSCECLYNLCQRQREVAHG